MFDQNALIYSHDMVQTSNCAETFFLLTSSDIKNNVKATKIINAFVSPSYKYVQFWSKPIHPFEKYGADKSFLTL